MSPGRRVGFLFNHDQVHQVAHSLPVALALARTGQADVVLASTHPRLTAEIRRLADGALPAPLVELDLTRPASRLAAAALDGLAPVRKLLMYGDNLPFFRGLDVLVVAEKTALRLKRAPGLERLRLVHTRHGAGDRAVGFDRASARFDRVLVSGAKVAERLVAQSGVDPARIRVVGYPKFDIAGAQPPPRLFADDRPVVLYNPHGSPHLSSWYAMGRRVLDVFARSARYNLIFAPHVMLFRRPVTISIDKLAAAFPGCVPRRAREAENILVDLGSPACSDMTYVEAADIYMGDVSSQVYEFLRRPRPCVFLNPRRRAWRDDPDFLHWRAGRVVEDVAELETALEQAPGEHAARYAGAQRELFAYTFDLTGEPSSERAAAAILQMIGEARPRG
ncbi:MAG: hypothetical protein INR64_01885 [Caulobacteraceae bacterium]|nr:hypothetical protein [Caulobacter sp.]